MPWVIKLYTKIAFEFAFWIMVYLHKCITVHLQIPYNLNCNCSQGGNLNKSIVTLKLNQRIYVKFIHLDFSINYLFLVFLLFILHKYSNVNGLSDIKNGKLTLCCNLKFLLRKINSPNFWKRISLLKWILQKNKTLINSKSLN